MWEAPISSLRYPRGQNSVTLFTEYHSAIPIVGIAIILALVGDVVVVVMLEAVAPLLANLPGQLFDTVTAPASSVAAINFPGLCLVPRGCVYKMTLLELLTADVAAAAAAAATAAAAV